jgi:putative spermidine/putrescine transport system substrate-binding protein
VDRRLVILTYGGAFRDGLERALFEPFARTHRVDVRLVEGDNIGVLDRSAAEVAGGHPAYDLTTTNLTYYQQGVERRLWEPVDYTCFDSADLAAVPAALRFTYGIASYVHSNNLVFSTAAFPDGGGQPASWADFWDVQAFPGLRALPVCDSGINPLPEIALLADGVAPDRLYPIDIDRAVRKLNELLPHTVRWRDGAESVALLADRTATLGLIGNARAQVAIDRGAPLRIVWERARRTFDVWYVLRGAPHRDEAMRFLSFAQRPERQADLARYTGLAPTNPIAYQHLDAKISRRLPGHPANRDRMFANDERWWQANRARWVDACKRSALA